MLFPLPGMLFPWVRTQLILPSFRPLLRCHLSDTFLGHPILTAARPHPLLYLFHSVYPVIPSDAPWTSQRCFVSCFPLPLEWKHQEGREPGLFYLPGHVGPCDPAHSAQSKTLRFSGQRRRKHGVLGVLQSRHGNPALRLTSLDHGALRQDKERRLPTPLENL